MKFCSKCGNQLDDSAAFCNRCGANLNAGAEQPAAEQQNFAASSTGAPDQRFNQVQQNGFSQPAYQAATPNAAPVKSAIDVIRAFAKAPIFLVGMIAMSLSVLLSFIKQISDNSANFDSVRDIFDKVGLGSEAENIISTAEGASVFSILIGIAPAVLIAVGLWLTYLSAISGAGTIKTSGLTMIKVVNIIELVFICIAMFVAEVLVLLAIFGVSKVSEEANSRDTAILSFAGGLLWVVFFVVAAVAVLIIVYLVKIVSSINTAKRTLASGVASDKVSGFVAVMAFIGAFFNIISVFSSEGAAAVLGALCGAVASICFGVLIFQYKNAMRPIMYARGA